MSDRKEKIIVIVGPTASGKTGWALEIARDCGGEIVSADSRQVYRGMDIGTAKEVPEDVAHHLIDVVDPDDDWTLAHFLDLAKKAIADIHARGNIPIIVGGTGLYVQALVENWDVPDVAPNKKLRAELEKNSAEELRAEMKKIDPEEAERLGVGKRYLIRALEMWRATGKKPSELKQKCEPLYNALVIGADVPREKLYERIDARVEEMFDEGLIEEVRGLLKKYPPDLPAFKAIGYREIIEARVTAGFSLRKSSNNPRTLKGAATFDMIKQHIKFNTHEYARRQTAWLKRMKYIKWCKNFENAYELVQKFLK